jgi:hypothetical protein
MFAQTQISLKFDVQNRLKPVRFSNRFSEPVRLLNRFAKPVRFSNRLSEPVRLLKRFSKVRNENMYNAFKFYKVFFLFY